MDLNKVQLIWNNVSDIELKQTPNWQNVTTLSVATNRKWTNQSTWEIQEEVEFHNIVLWWNLAEIASKYLKKWNKVYIEWRLATKMWQDNEWTKRYKTEIIWENLILLWGKREKDEFKESDQKHWIWNDEITIDDIPF